MPAADDLAAMLKDASRQKFEIVMTAALDQLGRTVAELCRTIQHLQACGVELYLEEQSIDTTTRPGRMIFQLTGAFAEFERSRLSQRVKAGARTKGVKLGRPRIKPSVESRIVALRDKGCGIHTIRKKLGVGVSAIQRVFKEVPWNPAHR